MPNDDPDGGRKPLNAAPEPAPPASADTSLSSALSTSEIEQRARLASGQVVAKPPVPINDRVRHIEEALRGHRVQLALGPWNSIAEHVRLLTSPPWLETMTRQQELFRSLRSNPLFDQVRRMAEQGQALQSNAVLLGPHLRGLMETSARIAQQFQAAHRAAQQQVDVLRSFRQGAEEVFERIRLADKTFRLQLPSLPSDFQYEQLRNLHRDYEAMVRPSWQLVADLGMARAAAPNLTRDLLSELTAPEDSSPTFATVAEGARIADDPKDRTERFLALLERALASLVDGARAHSASVISAISYEHMIAVLTFLGMIYGLRLAEQQVELGREQVELGREQVRLAQEALRAEPPAAAAQVEEILRPIRQEMERRRGDDDDRRSLRVVANTSRLMAEAASEALEIGTVYPDQYVRLIEVQGDWAHVDVYDFRSARVATGWVRRRVLRRLAH